MNNSFSAGPSSAGRSRERWTGRKRLLAVSMSGVIAIALASLPGAGLAFDDRTGDAAGAARLGSANTATASDGLLHYGGGAVVTGAPRVYLIFWGSGWGTATTNAQGDMTFSNDPYGGAPRLQEMYKGLGTNGELWSGVMTQYCKGVALSATTCPNTAAHVAYPDGHTLAHVYYDDRPVPTSPTAQQLDAEAVSMAGKLGNSPNSQYVIASPTGSQPEGFPNSDFCARHGDASSSLGSVVYTDLPYVMDAGAHCGMNLLNPGAAGYLDGYTFVASHEYAESITDPILSWGWETAGGGALETGDLCLPPLILLGPAVPANVQFATGSFVMTATWSNDTNSCATAHTILPLHTQVPNLVGDTLTQAKQVLTAHGLVLGTTSNRVDCNNLGLVTSQNPAPGANVLVGSAVNVTVGTRPAPPAVCS